MAGDGAAFPTLPPELWAQVLERHGTPLGLARLPARAVFVDGARGDDGAPGDEARPLRTIQAGACTPACIHGPARPRLASSAAVLVSPRISL